MKITVVGLGYVGLSNAVLLAQHNEVKGVDINQDRGDAVNAKTSPRVGNGHYAGSPREPENPETCSPVDDGLVGIREIHDY